MLPCRRKATHKADKVCAVRKDQQVRAAVRKAWFAGNQFSSVHVQVVVPAVVVRVDLRAAVRNLTGQAVAMNSAVVRIQPAPRVEVFRRVREWVAR